DAVAAECARDHLGAALPAGYLELDSEAEGAEALLERRAAEPAEHRGGADRRRQRQMVLRLGLVDPERGEEAKVEVAMIRLAHESQLAGQVARHEARRLALEQRRR